MLIAYKACMFILWANSGAKYYWTFIWAPSSEFVSSSIPSWQISTAHAQPFRGARDLVFCLTVPLYSVLVWASSGGSGETARMRRLAWTFAAHIGDKYQIRLTRSIWFFCLCTQIIIESPHGKTKKIICAPSEDSDQPGHPPTDQSSLWDAQADLSIRCALNG